MVENIYALKNKILEYVDNEARDLDRVNAKELGEFVDMIKDLAESEEKCWEASYYKSITESMGSSGYSGSMGGSSHSGYGSTGASGYNSLRSGYQEDKGDILGMLDSEYHNLGPSERAAMKNKVLTILGIK